MDWAAARTVDDLRRLESGLAEALIGTSKDFFIPRCPDVHWEVERKPYHTDVLVLRPNQPVSRAWDFVFRIVLSRITSPGYGPVEYWIPPQPQELTVGPRALLIELPDEDRAASKHAVQLINPATDVANAVTRDAGLACAREHETLARDLGLVRPGPGFN